MNECPSLGTPGTTRCPHCHRPGTSWSSTPQLQHLPGFPSLYFCFSSSPKSFPQVLWSTRGIRRLTSPLLWLPIPVLIIIHLPDFHGEVSEPFPNIRVHFLHPIHSQKGQRPERERKLGGKFRTRQQSRGCWFLPPHPQHQPPKPWAQTPSPARLPCAQIRGGCTQTMEKVLFI